MLSQQVGNYRVIRLLGEGGMGAVYEAVHVEIGRKAAIKVLHPQFSQSPEIAGRFLNEARAVNIVSHPGLIGIFEFGKLPDGSAYIIMEYLEGDSLSRRLQNLGRMPLPDVLRLGRQIASALAAAHKKGIVHRDLKPDNIMIVSDSEAPGGERAKILDFGIAKVTADGADQQKTRTGMLMGTPIYMSPEQCRGATTVDDRTDVYALGVILYQLLTGQPPFHAEGMGELLAMHMFNAPVPIREVDPSVPEALSQLIHQMLAKAPGDRPAMAAVVVMLEHLGAARTGVMQAYQDTISAPQGAPPDSPSRLSAPRSAFAQGSVPSQVGPASQSPGTGQPRGPSQPPTSSLPPGSLPPSLPPPSSPRTLSLSGAPASTLNQAVGQTPTTPPRVSAGGRGKILVGGIALATLATVALGVIALGGRRSASSRPVIFAVNRSGAGTVLSSPPGIECGPRCKAEFPPGTIVTLKARPEESAAFAGWSGACAGQGECGLAALKDVEVAARFERAAAQRTCSDGFCLTRAKRGGTLLGLWGSTTRDLWAVGDRGLILHFDGESWTEVPGGTGATLRDVYGISGSDVWAVGDRGTVLHFDGVKWAPVPGGTALGLLGVWGTMGARGREVWAVGQIGTVLHNDGSGFVAVPLQKLKTRPTLAGIWGSGPQDVWAVGSAGSVLHWDGKSLSQAKVKVKGGKSLTAVSGTGPQDVWAVGQGGEVLHFDGRHFTEMSAGTSSVLTGVFARRPDDVWAVGDYGTLLRYHGAGWAGVPTARAGVTGTLTRAFATRAGTLWVVGSDGAILSQTSP